MYLHWQKCDYSDKIKCHPLHLSLAELVQVMEAFLPPEKRWYFKYNPWPQSNPAKPLTPHWPKEATPSSEIPRWKASDFWGPQSSWFIPKAFQLTKAHDGIAGWCTFQRTLNKHRNVYLHKLLFLDKHWGKLWRQ